MCGEKYDLTYQDLNPTFLFTCKGQKLGNDNYHKHDFMEIGYVLSGRVKFVIEGSTLTAATGDVILLNPGTRHQSIALDEKDPAVVFYVGFSDFQFRHMPRNSIVLKDGGYILHSDTQLRQKLNQLCYNMSSENGSRMPGRYFMQKSYLVQFLLLIVREQIEPLKAQIEYEFESFNKTYIVEQIINYFHEHYNEKISLDQIAQNMYLSPFYISKIFKSETGETPINYLINIRLDKAKSYLESNDNSNIKDVAAKVGYEDVYHFSKLFKKHFGSSPSHFKKGKSQNA